MDFLPIAKDTILKKVEDRVRTAARTYVGRWIADDLLAVCRRAGPDLADLWDTPEARAKVGRERGRGRALVETL